MILTTIKKTRHLCIYGGELFKKKHLKKARFLAPESILYPAPESASNRESALYSIFFRDV